MKIVSVTHANDIDGIASAALIKMKYGMPSSRIFFTDYSERRVAYVGKSVERIARRERGTVLFLTDLGMNKILIGHYKGMIRSVKRNGGIVIWLDHHIWEDYALKEVAAMCDVAIVGENEKYCATEITYRNLKVYGRFAKKLVELVHYSDFNIKPKNRKTYRLIGIYAMSIMLYNTFEPYQKRDKALRHVVDVLLQKKFTDERIVRDARRFDRTNRVKLASMLKNLYKAGDDAYVGFSENLQSTQACGAIMDKTGCDIGIYINLAKGTAHLRSREFDTTKLSIPLRGGGHPHASSFPIDMKRFNRFRAENDRKRFVEFMTGRIRRSH